MFFEYANLIYHVAIARNIFEFKFDVYYIYAVLLKSKQIGIISQAQRHVFWPNAAWLMYYLTSNIHCVSATEEKRPHESLVA